MSLIPELDILPVVNGSEHSKPFVIAGPCSAENEQQVRETARQVAAISNVSVYRCGVWKPRTRPGSFEGVGNIALEWLKDVKAETGLKVAVEVATASHVQDALNAGVDMLWLGARTTVNPFSVSEIAEAIRGVDVPVLIKNPVNPDVELWIGAIERIARVGVKRIAAVHRGFATYEKTIYKNAPLWDIPIELRRRIPEIELIIDPSHIAGRREYLSDLCQTALDLNFEGLMIESHIKPEKALSDSMQQITPSELEKLLKSLVVREENSENVEFITKLETLRARIDEIDRQILMSLSNRMEACREIGEYKLQNNITVLQLKRWNKIFESRVETGKTLGLDEKFLSEILRVVHQESIRIQEQIVKNSEGSATSTSSF